MWNIEDLWVCEDCMLTHNGYTFHELGRSPECEPWSLTDGWDVVQADDEQTFSWSPCDGCGTPLGGSRYLFHYFED